MDKSLKNGMLLIAFAMLLLTVSINIDSVINLISSFFSLLMPVIFGLIFAFILSVPMKFFENFLSKHLHKQVSKKLSYLAFLLTLLSVILVIVVVAVIVVPQLSRSIIELSRLIQNQLPGLLDTLESYNIDVSLIEKWVKDFDYKLIGKPYGCSPMLEAMGITNYDRPGIEHDFVDCIDYADYTLGNALGIGIGMKLAKPEAKIFVLISDAQLYMGNVLESLILFKEFDFKDFLICIDYNNKGSKEFNSFEFNNLNLFKVKECKLDLENLTLRTYRY